MPTLVFLGKNVDGGVSNLLGQKLQDVEADLRTIAPTDIPFFDWCDIHEPHRGQHPGGNHTNGNAIDVNYTSNPYIATRSRLGAGVDYGGEAPVITGMFMARVIATVVCDRAVAFLGAQADVANLSGRGTGEATEDVYDRFALASTGLATYLQLAFQTPGPDSTGLIPLISRAPNANPSGQSLSQLLAAIPITERLDETVARSKISDRLTDPAFASSHPAWSTDEDFWLRQILCDYELVRIPMEVGNPSLTPAVTRNPANGFLDLRREIVVSLCSVGSLRWGASDFGNSESGDIQHFDTSAVIPCATGNSSEIRIDLQTDAGVQQALASLGFNPGPIDGTPGPATQGAINQFRANRGLPSGGIDDTLRDELGNALEEAAIPF